MCLVAGGAAIAAATAGQALQAIGTVAAVGGSIWQGVQTRRATQAQIGAIQDQKNQTALAGAVQDQRYREQFSRQISRQRAELAARGIDLGSPTSIYLGQSAAEELAFGSASIRQNASAQVDELTSSQRMLRAQGQNAFLRGGLSAAGSVISAAPDIWPELLA